MARLPALSRARQITTSSCSLQFICCRETPSKRIPIEYHSIQCRSRFHLFRRQSRWFHRRSRTTCLSNPRPTHSSLLPETSVNPQYSQLYIYDPHSAYQYRVSRNSNLSLNTLSILQQVMFHHNSYSAIYQHAYEVLRMYDAPDFEIKLCVLPQAGNVPRRYNLQLLMKLVSSYLVMRTFKVTIVTSSFIFDQNTIIIQTTIATT